MEADLESDHRPYIDYSSRGHSGKQSPQPLQSQAQLPSFREIIPPLLKSPSTIPQQQLQQQQPHHHHHHHHNNHHHNNRHPRHPHPSQHNVSCLPPSGNLASPSYLGIGRQTSFATSPSESLHSSMPSLPEGFEDVNARGHDVMFAPQTQSMSTMDRGSAWMPTSQYQNLSAGFTQPTHSMSQLGSQQMSSRSPNLPPLQSIQRSSSGFEQTYATTASPMAYVTQAGAYPQVYSSTPQTTTDIDSTFNPRNLSYDATQYAGFTGNYPQTTRPYQAAVHSRFSAGTYDPYRYNTNYRTSYTDLNYSPHAMVSSQPATYGVPADIANAHNRRRRGNLPKSVTDILRSWFHDHLDHPYPSEEDKQIFIQKTGLTISQISNWFINARRRHWPALRQNRDRARNSASRRSNSAGGSV